MLHLSEHDRIKALHYATIDKSDPHHSCYHTDRTACDAGTGCGVDLAKGEEEGHIGLDALLLQHLAGADSLPC